MVDSVLADPRTAPLPPPERALFVLLEKVAHDTHLVRREDVEAARGAGVSDETLYDAITVCALFRFYNTWVDGTGVCGMAKEDFRMSGRRIATVGYHAPAPGTGAD